MCALPPASIIVENAPVTYGAFLVVLVRVTSALAGTQDIAFDPIIIIGAADGYIQLDPVISGDIRVVFYPSLNVVEQIGDKYLIQGILLPGKLLDVLHSITKGHSIFLANFIALFICAHQGISDRKTDHVPLVFHLFKALADFLFHLLDNLIMFPCRHW